MNFVSCEPCALRIDLKTINKTKEKHPNLLERKISIITKYKTRPDFYGLKLSCQIRINRLSVRRCRSNLLAPFFYRHQYISIDLVVGSQKSFVCLSLEVSFKKPTKSNIIVGRLLAIFSNMKSGWMSARRNVFYLQLRAVP